MFVEAETAASRISLVHRTPSRSKCEMSTPSFFIRWCTYRRVELFGSTPSFPNASDNVRDELAASSRRSLVYGLTGMVPLRSGHTFVTSYGVTNRSSDSHSVFRDRKRGRRLALGARRCLALPDYPAWAVEEAPSAGSPHPTSCFVWTPATGCGPWAGPLPPWTPYANSSPATGSTGLHDESAVGKPGGGQCPDVTFSPTTATSNRHTKKTRAAVAGSPSMTMPSTAAPAAPIPTHTP